MPLSGTVSIVRMLGLATVNLCTKSEIPTLTYYKDMKCNEKCKNLGGLEGKGSPKVIGNVAIW